MINEDQPTFLYIKLNSEIVSERRKQCLGYIDIERDLVKGIECYAELYVVKVKLDKLETDHA